LFILAPNPDTRPSGDPLYLLLGVIGSLPPLWWISTQSLPWWLRSFLPQAITLTLFFLTTEREKSAVEDVFGLVFTAEILRSCGWGF